MPLLAWMAVTALFLVLGAAASWIVWRREDLERSIPVFFGGTIVAFALGVNSLLLAGRTGPLFLILVWGTILGFLAWAPFLARAAWCGVDLVRRWMTGDDRGGGPRTYDRAEAFEKRRQWDQAIRVYKDAVASDPSDAVARMRIGEIEAGRGRLEEAASWYRSALPHVGPGRERATAVFRLSDLERELGRSDRARTAIEEYIAGEGDEKLVFYARRRLES